MPTEGYSLVEIAIILAVLGLLASGTYFWQSLYLLAMASLTGVWLAAGWLTVEGSRVLNAGAFPIPGSRYFQKSVALSGAQARKQGIVACVIGIALLFSIPCALFWLASAGGLKSMLAHAVARF